MTFSEAKIGSVADFIIIVKSATIRETKNKKPYMFLELFDGTDSLVANDWNGGTKMLPPRNSIWKVNAEVTEYPVGTKQLKINSMVPDTTMTVADFAPKSPIDIDDYLIVAQTWIDAIKNEEAKTLVKKIYADFEPKFKMAPAAKGVHHAYVAGCLRHTVDVTIKAALLARSTTDCCQDLCIAGAMLHDIGKLRTYTFDGPSIDYTDEGNLKDHIGIGVAIVENYRTPTNSDILDFIQHIILSHHGQYEWGSPVLPRCIEAWFVHLADMADARMATIQELSAKVPEGSKYSEKDYTAGNRTMFTPDYVRSVFSS